MMNRNFWYGPLVISVALVTLNATTESHASELAVSTSGRHLTVKDKPFFWLGDTVWLLAQVPSRDELEPYGPSSQCASGARQHPYGDSHAVERTG